MGFPAITLPGNPFLDHYLWVVDDPALQTPPRVVRKELERRKALILPHVSGQFALPGDPQTDLYMVPVSGGADSSALAITMTLLYPHIPFRFVFTDTLAETRDLYENMTNIEKFLGINVTRLEPDNGGLYGLIESYGGFLPSMKARWCTRELKLKPYEAFIEKIRGEGRLVHSFVGIRADEPKREGLVSKYDFIKTYFPFQHLGIDRRGVFAILQKTVGVPRLYNHRTRSGCSVCPFQRRSEFLGLLRWNPDEFETGIQYEKLTNRDLMRFDDTAVPLWKETGISTNHLSLPIPARVSVQTADEAPATDWKAANSTPSTGLFDGPMDKEAPEPMVDLWVGAEFFVHPGVGGHGVCWQELVTFSTTRGGLSRQMNAHYAHRLGTPEVKMMSREDMADELKLAVYHLQIPARLIDLSPPGKDSYTWQNGIALSQMKNIANHALRTLQAEGMRQTIGEYQGCPEGTFEAEYAEGLRKSLAKITGDLGMVVAMDLFEPKVQAGQKTCAQEETESLPARPLLELPSTEQGSLWGFDDHEGDDYRPSM